MRLGPCALKNAEIFQLMSRLLMLHYRFPPAQVVSSKRLGHMYLEAKPFFENIYVLTSEVGEAYATDPLLQLPIEHRTAISHRDLRSSVQQVPGKASRPIQQIKRHPIGQSLLNLRRRWPFFYLFGDGGKDYIRKMVSRAEAMIRKHKITHLFTSYGPYADLIIGHKIKKRFPHLYWIADFRDIFENRPAPKAFQWYPFWYLKKKIKLADRVTTVSEGLADRLRLLHPDVTVLYNGWGKFTNHLAITTPMLPFSIAYTGSLYSRWRALKVFFQALNRCTGEAVKATENKKIQFHYYGPDASACASSARLQLLTESRGFYPSVSMEKALRIQEGSHINLLLSWSHDKQKGVLNAKLFEYLAARRPIFAIVDGPVDDELIYWVESVGKGRCFFTEAHTLAEISAGLKGLIEEVREQRWKGPTEWPKKIKWSKQGPEFWKRVLE